MNFPEGVPWVVAVASPQPAMPAKAAMENIRWPLHGAVAAPGLPLAGLAPRRGDVDSGRRAPAVANLPRGLAALAKMLADMQDKSPHSKLHVTASGSGGSEAPFSASACRGFWR